MILNSIILGIIGVWQILLILLVLFLVFGVKWLPKFFDKTKKRFDKFMDGNKD